jgi:hypothetical protein
VTVAVSRGGTLAGTGGPCFRRPKRCAAIVNAIKPSPPKAAATPIPAFSPIDRPDLTTRDAGGEEGDIVEDADEAVTDVADFKTGNMVLEAEVEVESVALEVDVEVEDVAVSPVAVILDVDVGDEAVDVDVGDEVLDVDVRDEVLDVDVADKVNEVGLDSSVILK